MALHYGNFKGGLMKLLLATLLLTSAAFAETLTVKIDGMHCNGCKKIVTKKVCEDKTFSLKLDSCEVTVDTKIQQGTLIAKIKKDQKVTQDEFTALVKTAGEDYVVKTFELK